MVLLLMIIGREKEKRMVSFFLWLFSDWIWISKVGLKTWSMNYLIRLNSLFFYLILYILNKNLNEIYLKYLIDQCITSILFFYKLKKKKKWVEKPWLVTVTLIEHFHPKYIFKMVSYKSWDSSYICWRLETK